MFFHHYSKHINCSNLKTIIVFFSGYSIEFFTQFAFLLPSILITIFLLIAIIMVYFVLPETHARLL